MTQEERLELINLYSIQAEAAVQRLFHCMVSSPTRDDAYFEAQRMLKRIRELSSANPSS